MENRPLTSGEIAIAQSIFADAIDYGRVRLFKGKWWPFHPRNAAMAPMGDIYFHPDGAVWSDDFSKEPLGRQGFFIHEMTHVWQTQTAGRLYLLLMRHPFCRYSYELTAGKPFQRYGLEQQAEIVAHVFLAEHGARLNLPQVPTREMLPFGCRQEASAASPASSRHRPEPDAAGGP